MEQGCCKACTEHGYSLFLQLVLPRMSHEPSHYGTLFIGLLVVLGLFILYFESQPFEARFHAMRCVYLLRCCLFNLSWNLFVRRSRRSGRFFVFAHCALTLCLLFVGTGIKAVLTHSGEGTYEDEGWLLTGGLFGSCTLLLGIRMSHR